MKNELYRNGKEQNEAMSPYMEHQKTLPHLGLRQIRHNTVSRHELTEIHIKKIIEYNKILDRLEDEGVYQLPYRIPQPPSE